MKANSNLTAVPASPEMPVLFGVEKTNPLLSAGNVFDGIDRITQYAHFLYRGVSETVRDDGDAGFSAALWVLLDALQKEREALHEYHDKCVEQREERTEGGGA